MEQETTVGYIYMLKLHHLVDDKVHARSTGPYSLDYPATTGRQGAVRWPAVRGNGSLGVGGLWRRIHSCRSLLTVKSDDVEGRTKIYESMVKGENTLEAGTPASFDVLTNEIRGLGVEHATRKATEFRRGSTLPPRLTSIRPIRHHPHGDSSNPPQGATGKS